MSLHKPLEEITPDDFFIGKQQRAKYLASITVPYTPVDAVAATLEAGTTIGAAGLVYAAVQSSLARTNVGAMRMLRQTGKCVGVFGSVGASLGFVTAFTGNMRQKADAWNSFAGGAAGGTALGLGLGAPLLKTVRMAGMLAVLMGTFEACGGMIGRATQTMEIDGEPTDDRLAYKEWLQKNKRRPVEETIMELGEGRGIYGEGYELRRAKRIKENYGIDVPIGPQSAGGARDGS